MPERSVLLLEEGPDYPDFNQLPDELKFGYGTRFGFTANAAVGGTHDRDYVGKVTDLSLSRWPFRRAGS